MVFIDVGELAGGDRACGYSVFQHVQHMVAGGRGYREGLARAIIQNRHIAGRIYGTVCARARDYRHDRWYNKSVAVQCNCAIFRQSSAVQYCSVFQGDFFCGQYAALDFSQSPDSRRIT